MKIRSVLLLFFLNLTNLILCQNCYPDSTKDFNQLFLNLHNAYRKNHSSPILTLNDNLVKYSTDWSRNLVLKGHLQYSEGSSYGENLWITTGPEIFDPQKESPIEQWYKEIEYYSFADPEFSYETKQFVQMIWRSTKQMGCGVCTQERITVITCRYLPPGNIQGQFKANVFSKGGNIRRPILTENLPPEKAQLWMHLIYVLGVIIILLIVWILMKYLVNRSEDIKIEK